MKRILICAMMLGLLTSVSVAQRGRAAGGVGPTARMPGMEPVAPAGRIGPNAVTLGHGVGVPPDAISTASHSKTVTPNATSGSKAKTVSPNANTTPDRATMPDAQGSIDHTRIDPNQ